MLQIRLATPDDRGVILDLIEEAAAWLRTRDTDQWARPWPDEARRDARVLAGILAGRTWIVMDYGIPVASVTYRPDGNKALWSKAERNEPAGYMSRLVVSRKYAGTKVGAALTDWAGWRSRDEFSADYLRIDVWTTNVRLHRYYEERGFHFLRFCDDPYYPSAALFYKLTEDIDNSAGRYFWVIPALLAGARSGELFSRPTERSLVQDVDAASGAARRRPARTEPIGFLRAAASAAWLCLTSINGLFR